MGLFSSTASAPAELTKEEAFLGVLVGAMAADGEVAEEEVAGLWAAMARMRLYQGWGDGDFRRALRKVAGELKRDGLTALAPRLAAALPADLRPTAFVNACDLALADGAVTEAEEKFVADLQKHLGVGDEFAARVVDVLAVKNRG